MADWVVVLIVLVTVLMGVCTGWLAYRAKTSAQLSRALQDRLARSKELIAEQNRDLADRMTLSPTQKDYDEWRRRMDARRRKESKPR